MGSPVAAALGQRAVLEGVRGGVAGEVVHAVQGDVECPGDGLRGGEAHVHGGREAGAGGRGHVGHVAELHAGVGQGELQGGDGGLEVGAGGDLGDDAAERGVLGGARGEALSEQHPLGDEAEARLVAGRLDAEDDRGPGHFSSVIGLE